MRVMINGEEWRAVLARVRDVGAGFGQERVAILAARAALEAMGITVPVVADELDVSPPPPTTAAPVRTDPPDPEPVPDPPRKDLRRSARAAGAPARDGYCPHCDVVYGGAALATLPDGNRLCPAHGTAVRDVTETAEGRFETTRPRGVVRRLTPGAEDARCGAPIGGRICARPPGHEGRHAPRREDPS